MIIATSLFVQQDNNCRFHDPASSQKSVQHCKNSCSTAGIGSDCRYADHL